MRFNSLNSGMKVLATRTAAAAVLTLGFSASASALPDLFDFGINIDGTTTCGGGPCDTDGVADLSGVAGVNDAGFDYITGLGSIFVTVTGAGAHSVDLFLDHEFDAGINGFDNELAVTLGAPAAGQSWEIDEPGFGSIQNGSGGTQYFGDIFDNFLASAFDNQAWFDAIDGQSLTPPDDVSMGMGWDFVLAAGETADIEFATSLLDPGGFVIEHIDPDSQESVFLSSSLIIRGPGPGPDVDSTCTCEATGDCS